MVDVKNIVRLAELQERGDIPPTSEFALALAFAELHGHSAIRGGMGRWLGYDGMRWHFDDTLPSSTGRAGSAGRRRAECNKRKLGGTASARLLPPSSGWPEPIGGSRPPLTMGRRPWLLNTPEGVVDLRTGEMVRTGRRLLHPDNGRRPGGGCPRGGFPRPGHRRRHRASVAFLQRVCGYALTGVTREHALFFR